MKRLLVYAAFACGLFAQTNHLKRLSYADFSNTDGQVLSARGGLVQLFGFEQNKKARSTFTNSDGPAPHLPMIAPAQGSLKPRISYSFEIKPQNQFAGVVLQVRGLPDTSGKQTAEDLSSYQYLTVNADFEGTNAVRIELISKDNGIELPDGTHPQATFKVGAGMQSYTIPLKWFTQPDYAQAKLGDDDGPPEAHLRADRRARRSLKGSNRGSGHLVRKN
ncbi:MAG: hypothetical protein NVS9B15_18640 [Acidobacteriaceae bacterium]